MLSKITPCLWFDTQAEEAARWYTSIFPGGKITSIFHYPNDTPNEHGHQPGAVLMVSFELEGHSFTALNGGPHYKFTPAVSLQIDCADQQEVDYYWERLSEGGDPEAQQCSWLADKFGLSWQIVPRRQMELLLGEDRGKAARAFQAMLGMKKLIIAELEEAAAAG